MSRIASDAATEDRGTARTAPCRRLSTIQVESRRVSFVHASHGARAPSALTVSTVTPHDLFAFGRPLPRGYGRSCATRCFSTSGTSLPASVNALASACWLGAKIVRRFEETYSREPIVVRTESWKCGIT